MFHLPEVLSYSWATFCLTCADLVPGAYVPEVALRETITHKRPCALHMT